ncbi:MAG: RagB/SusD family nutrient uptake outer membrane protein [Bacteroidales bacterium]|nr:RagB/SusD family nutrient uptake outer membrane protein [Bacteroidales bacterium]
MNIKKILIIVSTTLMLCSSCENDFDPQIFGVLSPANYPSTVMEYEQLMMTCYIPFTTSWTYYLGSSKGNMHSWYIPEGGVLKHLDYTTDEMAPWISTGWGGAYLYLSKADFSQCVYYYRDGISANNPNHYPKTREVTRFTEIIGTIENAPANILPETKKMELLGEAHLCRGMMMYLLLHTYGPVPLIVNPDDVSNPEKLKNVVRPSLQDITDWIYDDFEFASANVAESQSERGRYTRDYARVCLMRHCLNEGYHTAGYYQKAIDLYHELQGKYSLFTKGDNPYADLFKVANEWNSEIIMAVSCSESSSGGSKEGNMNPFMMLAVPDKAATKDDLGNPTPFFLQGPGWGQTYNVAPVFYNTYDVADKRRKTILTRFYSTDGYWVTSADLGVRWDGYIINKFPIETATAPCYGTDIPLARWADVLLMFAEAEVRLSNAAPSSEAQDAVNKVRNRAGLGNLPAAATINADVFLDALLTERGHELLYEGVRKIDLIRFNQYAKRTKQSKGVLPTHQYVPLPDYAVQEAASYGKTLEQTWSRDGWETDLASAL